MNDKDMSEEEILITVYDAADNRQGIAASLRAAMSDLHKGKHVLRHIFLRDFISQFRQRLLGYFWAVLTPLLGIATYIFMYLIGVLRPGTTDIPYGLFLFTGMGLWGVFIGAITTVSGSLVGQADLMLRTNVPPLVLALSGIAGLVYANIIHWLSVIILSLAFGWLPSPWALLYPIFLVPLFLFGVALGLILSVIGATARDVPGIVLNILGFILFVSPVFYSTELFNRYPLNLIATINPFTYFINVPRDMFFSGKSNYWFGYTIATLLIFIFLIISVHVFYAIKDQVAERL